MSTTVESSLANSIITQFIQIFVSSIIGIMSIPILIKMLGEAYYGIFELILSLSIINFFLEFGLGSTLVKYIPEYKDDDIQLRSFIWSYFYIKLLLTLVGFLFILTVGYYFDRIFYLGEIKETYKLTISVYIFGIGLVVDSIVSFLTNILKGFVFFGTSSVLNIASLVTFFSIFYLYYTSVATYSIVAIAIIWFISKPIFLLIFTLFTFYKFSLIHLIIPVRFEYSRIRETLKFMFGMTWIVMLAQLFSRLPVMILGIIGGPFEVAAWAIMNKINSPLLLIQSAMVRPLIPILSEKKKIDTLSASKILQAARLHYLCISLLSVIVIVHSDMIIQLWLGTDFIGIAKLIKIFLAMFLLPNFSIFLMIYYAQGKTRINNIYVALNLVIGLGVSFMIFSSYGLHGFVLSYTSLRMIFTILFLCIYIKMYSFSVYNFFKYSVLRPLLIVALYIVCWMNIVNFFSFSFFGLSLSAILSLLFYTVLFYLIMYKDDKRMLNNILHSARYKVVDMACSISSHE